MKDNLTKYIVWCTTNQRNVFVDFITYVINSFSGIDDFIIFCPSDSSIRPLTEVAEDLPRPQMRIHATPKPSPNYSQNTSFANNFLPLSQIRECPIHAVFAIFSFWSTQNLCFRLSKHGQTTIIFYVVMYFYLLWFCLFNISI